MESEAKRESIVIVDFGSQWCHLIARRLRELGVYSEIVPFDITLEQLLHKSPKGLILSGGPASIYEPNAPRLSFHLSKVKMPILGICYGHQLMASEFGGKVVRVPIREYGIRELRVLPSPLSIFREWGLQETVLMSHGDQVVEIPPGFETIASTDSCTHATIADTDNHIGVQFHPEVQHTPKGKALLKNFIKICQISYHWDSGDQIENIVHEFTESLDGHVLMGVSGGIDSTVAALLLDRARPDLLHCVFVNTGLLRNKEEEEVARICTELFHNFHVVDASEKFLERLKTVVDPEEKRKIVGRTFVEVFEAKAHELEAKGIKFKYLGQGTIYPDRIESSQPSKTSSRIKTHHNVGALPEKMHLKVIEPLKEFYKNEVREIGKKMGIPERFVNRKPFPGPGLAVRCIGEVTKERLSVLRRADEILIQELERTIYWEGLWQAFIVLLPVRSVGVMGDERTYEETAVIRVVESVDAMTATVPELPMGLLKDVATRITSEVKGVNRVTFDLTGKPPSTIEWE